MSARHKTLTITGSGAGVTYTSPYIMDWRSGVRTNVMITMDTDGSTTTGTLQYTCDDPYGEYATDFATNAHWIDHPDLQDKTADAEGNIAFPCTAVRVEAGASGTDTWTVQILQGV